ncbi:MAG: tRNA uridine-5-carboxymethylaminomethyl(34) synthesis enzyme MnmG [Sedimentisphaerales bacterium]|nr:tRNA uridine-5-carboxymethylaminomethyl(34) synthesis enzyme MnmG [Sedimentisphaerales bacterium]
MNDKYDILVVGGGHAGVEAAHAASRLGLKTALITIDEKTIAQMSCNPAIGGLAKGQIVREVDALGGIMGLATDIAGIQFRMLNRSKGPAVWAPRAQADKQLYQDTILQILKQCDSLDIITDTVDELFVQDGIVRGVLCASGREISASAVILTTGTFLRGLMHVGADQIPGGRYGEPAANHLSGSLEKAGLHLERLKTGTPPRIDSDSIEYDQLKEQPGDDEPVPFSFMNDSITQEQVSCWITYTNETTHEILRSNLERAPLYSGQIKSTGPRYCPSIETKILRFADKTRHQVFLEPEGRDTNWVYCNGISTSVPKDVQEQMVHSIAGLAQAEILRYAYAIEYDYVPPLQIHATLESKKVKGLFLAGQINGTSGYEEAAGQGLIAGINAAGMIKGLEPVMLRRDQAYIGVMIDDLVTKGVDEPYRMFTSRAEHRLLLRSDNADQRLTPLGREWGLVSDDRWQRFRNKDHQTHQISEYLNNKTFEGKPLIQLLRQQGRNEDWLLNFDEELATRNFDKTALQQVVNDIRYAGYVEKQKRLVERFQQAEKIKLPPDLDYHRVPQLRCEAQEKLIAVAPANLGQASRISGITPADITVLMIHLKERKMIDRKQ